MSKSTSVHILANAATTRALGELGKPVVDVTVRGKIVKQNNQSFLVLEQLTSRKSKRLPIIASAATQKKLAALAQNANPTEIVINGQVLEGAAGNTLVLSNVVTSKSLPIIADADTRKLLADLTDAGQEVTVKAKVVQQGGTKMLVLGKK